MQYDNTDPGFLDKELSADFVRSSPAKPKTAELRVPSIEERTSNKVPNYNTNSLPSFWKVKNRSSLFRDEQSSCSVREKIAIFSSASSQNATNTPATNLRKHSKSSDNIFSSTENSNGLKSNEMPDPETGILQDTPHKRNLSTILPDDPIEHYTYRRSKARSSLDLTLNATPKERDNIVPKLQKRHSFSQSLFDIHNVQETTKSDRWSILAEQRHKSLSKLKGLIIPEKVDEVEDPIFVDLPEIKIKDPPLIQRDFTVSPTQPNAKTELSSCYYTPSVNTGLWDCTRSTIPKYSPAFKRKDLKLHNNELQKTIDNVVECDSTSVLNNLESNYSLLLDDNETCRELKNSEGLIEAPRSLESITSPTQSDCSFEYNSSSSDTKQDLSNKKKQILSYSVPNAKDYVMKSEDESDNDSAVSSSQSSYISKVSPPVSPNGYPNNFLGHTNEIKGHSRLDNSLHNRLLKAHSVEAINRKNILASAKCRSGQDLKRGSPLIQTQFQEISNGTDTQTTKLTIPEPTFIENYKTHNDEKQNENDSFGQVDCFSEKKVDSSINKEEQLQAQIKNCIYDNKALKKHDTAKLKYANSKTREDILADTIINTHEKSFTKPSFKDTRSASVTDLRRSFEKLMPVPLESKTVFGKNTHAPTIKQVQAKECAIVSANVPKINTSITANSIDTSKIGENKADVETITLIPDIPGGRVGITLAGGADYETKDVTIYKIRSGSPAQQDGRLQKGDRIVAINGKSIAGLMHAELVAAIKEPLPTVTLTVTRKKESMLLPNLPPLSKTITNGLVNAKPKDTDTGSIYVVPILKGPSGLGFSLDGGQDSPMGNMPLIIKKVFKGGAAEKCGTIYIGDQLLKINDTDVSGLTRFEAWSVLKKLPEGEAILLTIKR